MGGKDEEEEAMFWSHHLGLGAAFSPLHKDLLGPVSCL